MMATRRWQCVLLCALALGALGCASLGTQRAEPGGGEAWRAIHLIAYTGDEDLEELSVLVPALAAMGINVLILEVDYNFAYASHPQLQRGERPFTREGARRLSALCRRSGIRLIPQFQCLGHQSWKSETMPLLIHYPHFDLTPGAYPGNEGIYCREWDPLNPEVNAVVFALLDELIDAFQADAVHVGMDEVFLLGDEHSPSTRGRDPAELFAGAVNDLHQHLVKERGVDMLMWGDRLIDGARYDYGGGWEASLNGTAPALDLISRDIIICDWHYGQRQTYPSVAMFAEKGFRVLPTSWNEVEATRALIAYSRSVQGAVLGHLFTTWSQREDLTGWPPLVEGLKLLATPP